MLAARVALAAAAALAYGSLAQELIPSEDRGVLNVRINAPDGASLAYTDRYDPNRAEIVASLRDWSLRQSSSTSQGVPAQRVQQALDDLPGARQQRSKRGWQR